MKKTKKKKIRVLRVKTKKKKKKIVGSTQEPSTRFMDSYLRLWNSF